MAALRQPDAADLQAIAIEFDMARVAIGGIVEDIGGRDEAFERKTALNLIIEPARIGIPAVLERNETRIERELQRERDRGCRAGKSAEADRGIGALLDP